MTTKLSDLETLEKVGAVNPETGKPADPEASMLLRRLKIYKYTKKLDPPPRGRFTACAHCFARLVLTHASEVPVQDVAVDFF